MTRLKYPRLTFFLGAWLLFNAIGVGLILDEPCTPERKLELMPRVPLVSLPIAIFLFVVLQISAPWFETRDGRRAGVKYPRLTFLFLFWLLFNVVFFIYLLIAPGIPERKVETIPIVPMLAFGVALLLLAALDNFAPFFQRKHDGIYLDAPDDAEVAESKKDDFVFDESKSLKGNIEELRKRQDGS